MGLLELLQSAMDGQDDDEDDEDKIGGMLAVEPPPDVRSQPIQATAPMDMAQPTAGTPDSKLGHPDVLSFLKELDTSGRLTGGKSQDPTAPKGMGMAQQTVRSEEGGVPADVRAQGVAVRGQAEVDGMYSLAQQKRLEAEQLDRDAAKRHAEVQAEEEARKAQEAEVAKKQERLRGQQEALANQADEPINPQRYFDNMSTFSKFSAVLSAAIYGYLGGKGQAPVAEQLMQMAKEDVQAQIENNRASVGKRSALIQQYEREYGDTTLVSKRLEADKLLTLAKEARSQGEQAKSREAKAAAEDIVKQMESRVGVIHQEIQEATFGKPIETSTTFQPLKRAGAGDPGANMKKAYALAKQAREEGANDDQVKGIYSAFGVAAPTGKPASDIAADTATKKDVDARRSKYATENIELADEETALETTAKAMGGSYDKESGELKLPKDLTGFGVGTALRGLPGTEAKAAHEALKNLTDVKQRQRSGAGSSESEVKLMKEIVGGDNLYGLDESSVKNSLKQVAASLKSRRRAADAGAGEDVLTSYKDEEDKLPKGLQVSPLTGKVHR
jgi:hypothetical protein